MFLKINFLILCLFFYSCSISDFNQNLPDQLKNDQRKDEWIKNTRSDSPFVEAKVSDRWVLEESKKEEKHFLPDNEIKKLSQDYDFSNENDINVDESYLIPRSENREFKVPSRADFSYTQRKKGTDSFSFGYRKDDLKVSDSNGSFNQTFNDSENSSRYGFIYLKAKKYLYRSYVDLDFAVGLAVGYSKAKAKFSSGEVDTKTKLTLTNVPLDFSLGLSIRPNRFFTLRASGGGVGAVLIQDRSDYSHDETGKTNIQAGFGYFTEGSLAFSLSDLSSEFFSKMYQSYKITKVFLELSVRNEMIKGFKEDIELEGQTYSIGVTFEYF